MHQTRLLWAALCVLAMSACSVAVQGEAEPADRSAPPATAAPGGQRSADAAQVDAACPLLDAGKVGATLGGEQARAVEQPVEEKADGTRAMYCMYQVSERSAVALLQFTVLPGGVSPSEIIARVSAAGEGDGEPIEGLGEAAVLTRDGETVELSSAFTAGGTSVLTSLTASKAATKDMIQPLLAEVVDKF
jgi:hypothetical protein